MFGKNKKEDSNAKTIDGYLGSLSFDGQAVTITKKLRGATSIPVAQIAGIDFLPAGLGMKGVRFAAAGGSQAKSTKAFGSHKDLAADPQALTFKSSRQGEFEAFVAEIRAAMASGSAPAASTPDLASQLANLAQLHADGILSADEFAAAKAKLVG